MKFKSFTILLFLLGLNLNNSLCYSENEILNTIQINKELVCDNDNSQELQESSQENNDHLTHIIDKLVEWNKRYIIPLSCAYIGFDLSKNLFGIVKNLLTVSKSEKIFPDYVGDNPLYQKIVSHVNEVAAKVGKQPRSIIIIDNKLNWAGASDENLIFSKTFFENNSIKEAEFVLAHELSHIKRDHSTLKAAILAPTIISSGSIGISLNIVDYDHSNNFKKIIRMIYTSPLLYYFCVKIIWYALSRYCEKNADLIAAAAVGAEGGIEFFGKRLNRHETGLFDSHPSNQERVDYLQAFKLNN